MLKRILFLLTVGFLSYSCKEDCYTAPEPVVFEFVNAQGDNLIENGTLENFTIQEVLQNGNMVGVQLTETSDYKVKLERVGSFNGTKQYSFFSELEIFDFSIRSSKVMTDCDGFKIDEIEFDNMIVTHQNGFYTIKLLY